MTSDIADSMMADSSGPTSITAAAHAYQLAMSQHPSPSVVPTPILHTADPTPSMPESTRDALPNSFLPEIADVSNIIVVSVYYLLMAF
jgi:hypothetical protein